MAMETVKKAKTPAKSKNRCKSSGRRNEGCGNGGTCGGGEEGGKVRGGEQDV